MRKTIAFFAISVGAASAFAGLEGLRLGVDAPPSFIGPWSMSPFPVDGRTFADVLTAPAPLGGEITFGTAVSVRQIGGGWATWSHGYTGTVYYTNGREQITVTMPAGTKAVYFYVEPGAFSVMPFTSSATTGTGETLAFSDGIQGRAGAQGYGFYTTDGSDIVSIHSSSPFDFSIGEFATSIPAPGSAALLGLAGLTARRRRR